MGEAQLGGLMNEMLDEVTTRKAFRQITREKVHTSLASADQGNIYTLTDAGYQRIIPETFWNRTTGLKVNLGLSEEEWQQRQVTGSVSGPTYSARVRENNLWLDPAPPAGDLFAFEYKTLFAVTDGSANTPKQYFTRDDDTCFLPDKLCIAYLTYAWKKEKGFSYAEDKIRFESILADQAAGDKQKSDAHLGGSRPTSFGVIVAEGSWPLS